MNSTRADNDEIYISFEMNDSGGALDEFARITVIATDVTNDTEDGAMVFSVADTDNNGDLQEAFRISSSTGGTVSATTTSVSQFNNTITVGVDDTGYDVKFFGASAGAYMLYDQSEDQLVIMGASADATTSTGKLLLATSLTNVNANDVLGKIEFQAPLEAGGTDAITVAAAIDAVAQGTFAAAVNATDLIFRTGHSEAATEKFRFTSQGELGVGGANYGSSGDVLTSGGAGAAPTWETPTTGDITGVTAGTGLSGGGTSGGVTLALDLSELTDTAIANGDYIVFTDTTDSNATVKGDLADVATLFAGTGLTASNSVIGVDASQTQITAVGTIATGVWQGTAIASAYIAGDAITGAKIADDAIDSEHYTDGSIDTAHIADDQVTLAKMAGLARGKIIYGDASGNPAALAVGSNNYVLTSDGTDISWAAAAAGGISTGKSIALSMIF